MKWLFLLLNSFLFHSLTTAQALRQTAERPQEVWATRSVLDQKPRMLTLALHSDAWAAYDLANGVLYKVWKGGVAMDGAPYTGKKEVQPTSWGTAYWVDSAEASGWEVRQKGKIIPNTLRSKGYRIQNNQLTLLYELQIPSGKVIQISERPEWRSASESQAVFERVFTTRQVPDGMTVFVKSPTEIFPLLPNATTQKNLVFKPLPVQFPPKEKKSYAHKGQEIIERSDCLTCHEMQEMAVGPGFLQIANRYEPTAENRKMLVAKVQGGGAGAWGDGLMNPHPDLAESELESMIDYIFSLKPKEKPTPKTPANLVTTTQKRKASPGHGAPLEGVHPSYTLQTLHTPEFMPKVGAMAFLPDGRMLVSTWDVVGGLYIVEEVPGKSPKVKRIAQGLAEPLGLEVVDGKIYVLQKQELTQLIDQDGDEIIDEYRTICNSWGVTADFHEFSFGLVHKAGYFYATLSMAMRLRPDQKQLPDRGRTIKIAPDGSYASINYGLRTPNGIGLGVDNELFLLDNQGQWLPANKLIHVRPGDYHGMAWGLPDGPENGPRMTPPTLWLPEDEIGNSPSEPVLVREGIFKGQMLHGDVTHGGIKRDFLEKINGTYQGAVFRFSQGFEAGVNRLRWGPDGSLYVGQVGMKGGGWSWKERLAGLQKLTYNGKSTFEMLAIRIRPTGFEIEFTQPISQIILDQVPDFQIQQWRYEPTARYGGPKLDLVNLEISNAKLSKDGTRLLLDIAGLKKEQVVYFRLPETLKSMTGETLWSSEAWYTLNEFPEN
ncbi:c-type cytochrome [Arundinibacter roseus]|uniref:C-type cytochrome n=1 Tax=Arundinibacter roseus TaxID=2070510 RepID=A0A4V2X7U7_9BACT|nr:c-type cytochrome [Arundinibacter roseus]TDB57365.1 c-type cytochrome [Arundinibacter roseus]